MDPVSLLPPSSPLPPAILLEAVPEWALLPGLLLLVSGASVLASCLALGIRPLRRRPPAGAGEAGP